MKVETVTHTSQASNRAAAAGVEPRRLIVFAPSWLGDAVMALPAIHAVRRAYPEAVVDVAARPSVAPLFTLVPDVGEVLTLHLRGARRREALDQLRRRGYDTALLLPNSFQSALTAWRAGIPERWGYRGDLRGPLLSRAFQRPFGLHQADVYLQLVRSLGFEAEPVAPRLAVPEAARAEARGMLRKAGWDDRAPLVALAPGAAFGGAKRWPEESFAALASAIVREGAGVVIVGSAGDREVAAEVNRLTPVKVIDLVGQTDIPALAGVLTSCRALVTNDSGAMHIAAALGTSVIAMFGPTDERATSPLGDVKPTILTRDLWCRPCLLRECPLDHRCMRGIGVQTVMDALHRVV